jgi:hypothetical protein
MWWAEWLLARAVIREHHTHTHTHTHILREREREREGERKGERVGGETHQWIDTAISRNTFLGNLRGRAPHILLMSFWNSSRMRVAKHISMSSLVIPFIAA